MICPECGSMKIEEIERGYYYCLECGHEFSEEDEFMEDETDFENSFLEEDEEEFLDYGDEEEEEF